MNHPKFPIIYSHKDFIAINKPANQSVHRDQDEHGLTEQLAQQLGIERLWLIHRLDKCTSGVLLLSLNAETATQFGQMFANKTVRKTYWAISDRKPSKKQGWVKGDMEKSRRGAWKLTRTMDNPAITQFTSEHMGAYRLFTLHPHTGKTHQLRVAMKSLGSAILGDTLYGGTPAPRVFLHAREVAFTYQGEDFCITAPVDEAWEDVFHSNDSKFDRG